jgi:hypothetical protein
MDDCNVQGIGVSNGGPIKKCKLPPTSLAALPAQIPE